MLPGQVHSGPPGIHASGKPTSSPQGTGAPPASAGRQDPKPRAAGKRGLGVQFDGRGWPDVPEPVAPLRIGPAGSGSAGADPNAWRPRPQRERSKGVASSANAGARTGNAEPARATASGMALGSPLLDVFQFTRSPQAFKNLGGQQIWWRVTIYGDGGEILGIREITHIADCSFAERDRVEYDTDGRVFGRNGGSVFAERQGMPWPTDAERGRHELALFGTHLRMPWCFGDSITYSVLSSDTVDRPGERLRRVRLERRPMQGSSLIGPQIDTRPRDQFEIVFEPGTGKPREFVHRFAAGGGRRVLLEDWREERGVRIPYRRIYVDDTLKKTTMLEILSIEPQRVAASQFRQ